MAINNPIPAPTGGGPVSWVESHPTIALAAAIVVALVLGGLFISNRNKTATTPGTASGNTATGTSGGDLSGLAVDANGNHIVYRDVADTFINESTITGSYNSPVSTTTTNNPPPVVIPPVVIPPTQVTPPAEHDHDNHNHNHDHDPHHSDNPDGRDHQPAHFPKPEPVPSGGRRIWDVNHTVVAGESLSSIAAAYGASMQKDGSGNVTASWHDLYSHNKGTVDVNAIAHGSPIPGGAWNNVFPGEVIKVPRWFKGQ